MNAKQMLLVALSAGCAGVTWGTQYQWRTKDGGDFTDAAKWSPQGVPATSSDLAFYSTDAQGAYTVKLPAGEWTNEAQLRVDVRAEATAIAFDGSETVWTPSTHASADYSGEPFSFFDTVSHYFSFEMYADKKGAPYRFEHPVFRATGAGGVSAVHFDSGVFNFYNPDGAAHNYDFTVGYGATGHALLGVHGADVSVANVNVRSRAAQTTLLVDAGTLDAKTKLEIPTSSGGDDRTAVDLIVTDAGTLRAGYLTLGYSGKPRDFRVRVADGGRFELPIPETYKFSQQTGASTVDWEVANGGTVYLGHCLAFAWGDGTTANVHLDRGNWLSYNETTLGADSEAVSCVFAATNSFIDAYQDNASAMVRLNQDMIVKDSLWTNNFLYAYGNNCSPTLAVEGGKWVNRSRLYFGTPNGAEMTIDGGDHEWYGQIYVGYESGKRGTVTFKSGKVTMSSGEMIALGYNGIGTFEIDGGEIAMPGGGGLALGLTQAGKGYVRMSGGRLSVPSCETGVCVGRAGLGEFLLSGGEIVLGKGLWLGHVAREVSEAYRCYFRQTGGTVDAAYLNLCHADALGEVALDGGVFTVGYIESWGGATAAGGTGKAILSADGGTLRAKFGTTGFINKIDGIVLGAEGLAIDTDYDVAIAAVPITSKDGASGRLVKRGAGTLRLNSPVADDVEIVVERGQVVFGQPVEIGALTIGTATSAGAIALAADASLTVKGAVNVFHDNSADEFAFVKGDDGKTQVVRDDSAAKTLEIRLDEAVVSNATDNVLFRAKDTLKAVVAEGGTLNLDGRLARGSFVKEGAGRATLAHSDNEFYGEVTVNGGALAAADLRALGLEFALSPQLALASGAFLYEGAAPAATKAGLSLQGQAATDALVVRTAANAVFAGGLNAVSGALVKTGPGELTLQAAGDQTIVAASSGTGTGAQGCPQGTVTLGSDGAFAGEHAGLSVAEGTLTIKGTGGETVSARNGVVAVGLNAAGLAAHPRLVVDDVTLDSTYRHFFVGGYVQQSDVFATNATLEVVNGGTLKCDTLRVGTASGASGNSPFIHLDGGTLDVGFRVNCADDQSNVHARFLIENGSIYKVGSYNYGSWQTYWEGDAEFVFDRSAYAVGGSEGWGYLYLQNGGRGAMLFRNGSSACIQTIDKRSGTNWKLTLAFDDSAWAAAPGDHDFLFRGGEAITVECRAGGMRLPVPEGATWTVHQKFTGDGAIVKEGSGTLVFDKAAYLDTYHGEQKEWADAASWAFAGAAQVKSGTLQVRTGACPATAQAVVEAGAVFAPDTDLAFGSVSGAGTVRGGGLSDCRLSGVTVDGTTLIRPTVALTVDGTTGAVTGTPNFVAAGFSGRVTFDFGRTAANPLPEQGFACAVATYAGTAPDLSRWRVANVGFAGGRGTFTAADGVVTMELARRGMVLILR